MNEINKIRVYEIQERKIRSEKLSKYTVAFDFFDKTLIALSSTNREISMFSSVSLIGASVGIASTCFSLVFSLLH